MFVGCGDDEDSTLASNEPDSGAPDGGNAGAGGAGDDGGATGGMGGAGSGGTPAVEPVECGTSTCEAPAAAMGFITACCFDAASSTCGTSLMGSACAEPPESDPRCPPVDFGGGAFVLASCCTVDGQCGIDASQFMMGCISLADAAAGAMMMMMGAPVDFPAPSSCDDADAGMDDAGL